MTNKIKVSFVFLCGSLIASFFMSANASIESKLNKIKEGVYSDSGKNIIFKVINSEKFSPKMQQRPAKYHYLKQVRYEDVSVMVADLVDEVDLKTAKLFTVTDGVTGKPYQLLRDKKGVYSGSLRMRLIDYC